MHPGVRLVEAQRQLSVHCEHPGDEHPRNLFEIPRELLIPVNGLNWSDRTDRLALANPPTGLTPVQEELLALHVELYNATRKLHWWSNDHPRRLLVENSGIREALRRLRPDIDMTAADTPAAGFLQTRTFRVRDEEERRNLVLMPLIDMLNHHHRGGALKLDDVAMRVAMSRPMGGAQCLAHYGRRRDVLELALYFGYLDHETPFAHDAPLRVNVPDLGDITMLAQTRAPAHRADPPSVEVAGGRIEISHLCCDLEHPERAPAVLRLALLRAARLRGLPMREAEDISRRLINDIAFANLERLTILEEGCLGSGLAGPAANTLRFAAKRQAHIIRTVLGGGITQRHSGCAAVTPESARTGCIARPKA